MHIRKLLLLLASVFAISGLQAQDIHFSQYNMSPMTLNPANLGAFEGTVRIGGIFRGQWASVIGNKGQYQTPSVYVDAPIIRGFRKKDWVGVGLMFFSDKAGVGKLTHSAAKLGASYHLALNKKGTTYLTLGAQYGQASRKLNPDGFLFEKGFTNPTSSGGYNQPLDVDFANLNRDNASWTDIDGGIVLKSQLNKQMDFSIGYAMYHIAEGKYGLVTGGSSGPGGPVQSSADEIGRRSVATGVFNIKLTEKFTLSPTFLYQTMSGADEIIVQGLGSYLFNPEKDITLLFGAGYRLRDAIHPIVGAQVKSLRVGLAYDINVSSLKSETGYRGGFELAAYYIVKIYKPAVVKTKVLCPRF
jgi:type IX secretion system PorP/SprF family membrane protein